MTGNESFRYCTIVTVLFFLWGFSKGLLITLVEQIKNLVQESVKQDIGLTASYSVGYFFGPLTVVSLFSGIGDSRPYL
jgi:fucose permease